MIFTLIRNLLPRRKTKKPPHGPGHQDRIDAHAEFNQLIRWAYRFSNNMTSGKQRNIAIVLDDCLFDVTITPKRLSDKAAERRLPKETT